MYIPLIPQRRDKLSSIWGPPSSAASHTLPPEPPPPAHRYWEHDPNTPSCIEPDLHASSTERREQVPRIANLGRIYQPDQLYRTRSEALLNSVCHPRREESIADMSAVTSLLGSLDLSAPSNYLDACLDPSFFSPSSTSSSPIDTIPTPPDASPIHSADARLPPSLSLMSPPHPLRTLPCETTVFEAGKPAHGDVANGISREAMLRERLTARLVDRQSHFQIESRGAHTAPHSPLETQREETLRPKISCSALQDYAMVASPTAKQLYADRAPVSSAPWSHAGQISPSRTSHARTLGYFARSLAFEDARDIDIGPMAINSQANDSLDGPGKVLPGPAQSNEPINFLHLLSPTSSPQYSVFVQRIIAHSDQQASIFLQQKLKASTDIPHERMRIVDAICGHGFEMMCNRFGNWAVQRCLDSNLTSDEKAKLASCMRGRVVELATNCYGTHCVQKFLDCEEKIRLDIVRELLMGDPCSTLLNKHASHVWSKIMELSWTPPAPPIFDYINDALSGKWMTLACHETGSLVVQHAFENLEPHAKEGIVQELLLNDAVFREVVKNQWGSFCISHLIELGSAHHRQLVLDLLLSNLSEYAAHEHGIKSVLKAVKEGNMVTRDRFVDRLCQPPHGGRRAMIIDIALSALGCQLLTNLLPGLNREQRARLYDAIRPFIVTLRGSKTGSKTIWLFDRMV